MLLLVGDGDAYIGTKWRTVIHWAKFSRQNSPGDWFRVLLRNYIIAYRAICEVQGPSRHQVPTDVTALVRVFNDAAKTSGLDLESSR